MKIRYSCKFKMCVIDNPSQYLAKMHGWGSFPNESDGMSAEGCFKTRTLMLKNVQNENIFQQIFF